MRRLWLLVLLALLPALASAGSLEMPNVAGANYRVPVTTLKEERFRNTIHQQYDFSCGSAAVATLLTYHYGRPTTEAQAFTAMYAGGDQAMIRKVGFSMLDMKRYFAARGVPAEGYRMSVDDIAAQGAPAIALIRLGAYRHFVVVKGVADDKVLVGDPALGLRVFTKAQFASVWNGVALVLREDDASGPGKFNEAAEWSPWAKAPIRKAAWQDTLNALTLHQMPLYQIAPVSVINGGDP